MHKPTIHNFFKIEIVVLVDSTVHADQGAIFIFCIGSCSRHLNDSVSENIILRKRANNVKYDVIVSLILCNLQYSARKASRAIQKCSNSSS